jgi:uncharacterized repeat protein (TIGR03803 family)
MTKLTCQKTAYVIVLLGVARAIASPAQTFTTLLSFGGSNGTSPSGALVQGLDGNFYGTTNQGGANNSGTVYKITPAGELTTLYSFCSQTNCTDGEYPRGGLVQASDSNFYGTTYAGGINGNNGTVFRITPAGALTTLYTFCPQTGCTHGEYPRGGLAQATDGNFYGITYEGGANNSGTVYKITPAGEVTTLYSFCSQNNCTDGRYSTAGSVAMARFSKSPRRAR